MKMKILGTVAVVAIASVLSLSAPVQAGTLGCLIGAGAGGFGGAQIGKGTGKTIATIAGALFGCGIASKIQDNDNQRYQRPQYRNQSNNGLRNISDYGNGNQSWQRNNSYQQVFTTRNRWQKPRYEQVVRAPQDSYCVSGYTREYQTTITIGGKQVPSYGTACYQPDGSWKQMGNIQPSR